jgi:haloalkane dehalogenase
MGPGFVAWNRMAAGFRASGDMPVGQMVGGQQGPDVVAAYDAPFPDKSYKAGPLIMPALVPVSPEDPAVSANQHAWEVFKTWQKPFLTAFSDGDPVTRGQDKKFVELVPGARDQKHITIKGAGHFLQQDKGEELAAVVIQFIKDNP